MRHLSYKSSLKFLRFLLGFDLQNPFEPTRSEARPPQAADLPAEAESEGGVNLCEIRF